VAVGSGSVANGQNSLGILGEITENPEAPDPSKNAVALGIASEVNEGADDSSALGPYSKVRIDSPDSTAVGGGTVGSECPNSVAILGVVNDGNSGGVAIGDGASVKNPQEGVIAVDQLQFGATGGTIPEADLGNESVTFEIDSAGDLLLKWKDSNGFVTSKKFARMD
jgi:hypothetical protein